MPWYQHGKPFTGYTVVIAGQGPSLNTEQLHDISYIYPTIAIKDTYEYAPNAQIIYACDRSWWFTRWKTDQALREHKADKVVLDYQKLDTKVPDLHWLKCNGNHGMSFQEGYVMHGRNSGHQALNLAVNMGAKKIILMGYDMRVIDGKAHFHNRHVPVPHSVFDTFYEAMLRAAPLLKERGIQVANTSMKSRLMCFFKMPYEEALEWGKHG